MTSEEHKASATSWKGQRSDFDSLPSTQASNSKQIARATVVSEFSSSIKPNPRFAVATFIRLAWSIVLAQHANAPEVIFGTTVDSNLPQDYSASASETTEPAILPIRVRIDSTASVIDTLQDLQEQERRICEHGSSEPNNVDGFEKDAAQACASQSVLICWPSSDDASCPGSPLGGANGIADSYADCPLIVDTSILRSKVIFRLAYDPNVITRRHAEMMQRHLNHVFQVLQDSVHCNKRLGDLDLLSPSDKSDILQWNSTLPQEHRDCLHKVIFAKASAYPDAVAVQSDGVELNYKELCSMAKRYGALLAKKGVRPRGIVPICYEKSPWSILAMLGVLSAGCGFWMSDPSLPVERIQVCRHLLLSPRSSCIRALQIDNDFSVSERSVLQCGE